MHPPKIKLLGGWIQNLGFRQQYVLFSEFSTKWWRRLRRQQRSSAFKHQLTRRYFTQQTYVCCQRISRKTALTFLWRSQWCHERKRLHYLTAHRAVLWYRICWIVQPVAHNILPPSCGNHHYDYSEETLRYRSVPLDKLLLLRCALVFTMVRICSTTLSAVTSIGVASGK